MGARLKKYWIAVKGHDGHEVTATSAGAARWAEYKAWREAGFARSYPHTISFKDFLTSQIETFHHAAMALASSRAANDTGPEVEHTVTPT